MKRNTKSLWGFVFAVVACDVLFTLICDQMMSGLYDGYGYSPWGFSYLELNIFAGISIKQFGLTGAIVYRCASVLLAFGISKLKFLAWSVYILPSMVVMHVIVLSFIIASLVLALW